MLRVYLNHLLTNCLTCMSLISIPQWCAATFCYVCGLANIPNPKSGYTPILVPKNRLIYQSGMNWERFVMENRDDIDNKVLAGSLYIPQKMRDGHTYAIVQVRGDYGMTYEGNVSDMVLAKKRYYRSINKIADWSPDFIPNKNTKLTGAKAVSDSEKTD